MKSILLLLTLSMSVAAQAQQTPCELEKAMAAARAASAEAKAEAKAMRTDALEKENAALRKRLATAPGAMLEAEQHSPALVAAHEAAQQQLKKLEAASAALMAEKQALITERNNLIVERDRLRAKAKTANRRTWISVAGAGVLAALGVFAW